MYKMSSHAHLGNVEYFVETARIEEARALREESPRALVAAYASKEAWASAVRSLLRALEEP